MQNKKNDEKITGPEIKKEENYFQKYCNKFSSYLASFKEANFIQNSKEKLEEYKKQTLTFSKKIYKICNILLNLSQHPLSFSLKNCILTLIVLIFLWIFYKVDFLMKIIILLSLIIIFKIIDENYNIIKKAESEIRTEENNEKEKQEKEKILEMNKENEKNFNEFLKNIDENFEKINIIISVQRERTMNIPIDNEHSYR
jgi:hypothetical protein